MSKDTINNVVHPEFLAGMTMVIKLVQDWSKENLPGDLAVQDMHVSFDFNQEPKAPIEVFNNGRHVRTIEMSQSKDTLIEKEVVKRKLSDMSYLERCELVEIMKETKLLSYSPINFDQQRFCP